MKYNGLGVAMVSPMNADKSIDFKGLENLTNYLIENGVDYLVVLGTTGESPTLSFNEKVSVLESVIQTNADRVPVVFGVGGNNTMAVVEQLKSVEHLNFSGVLSVSPAYNKPTQGGIIEHFKMVCSATKKDIILYNVPGRTASNMTADTTLKIAAACPNVVAIKEASGDMSQIMHLLRDKNSGFEIISGDDPLTLSMMSMGAKGVISVVGNALPKEMSEMIHLAQKGDFDSALPIHHSLLDFTEAIFSDGNPAGIKEALKIMGVCDHHLRLPLINVSEAVRNQIKECLKNRISEGHMA